MEEVFFASDEVIGLVLLAISATGLLTWILTGIYEERKRSREIEQERSYRDNDRKRWKRDEKNLIEEADQWERAYKDLRKRVKRLLKEEE